MSRLRHRLAARGCVLWTWRLRTLGCEKYFGGLGFCGVYKLVLERWISFLVSRFIDGWFQEIWRRVEWCCDCLLNEISICITQSTSLEHGPLNYHSYFILSCTQLDDLKSNVTLPSCIIDITTARPPTIGLVAFQTLTISESTLSEIAAANG